MAGDFTLDLSLQVGKYDIQKLLGKGATGTVYLAKDTFTGKEVALKTIEPEVFRDPDKLLPVADVLQIGFKCCGALDYAFKEGIVHRDIKPANIMIASGTDVKIADFGAAGLGTSQAG